MHRDYRTPQPIREARRPSPDLLERVYRLPRPALWNEDFERALHRDLDDLTDVGLEIELSRVWRRITLEDPALDHWLYQRRRALFSERDRRRGGRR